MPDLMGSWTVQDGAVIEILVGVNRTQLRSLRSALRPIPQPLRLKALLDSGAECTCLDTQTVRGLALTCKASNLASLPALSGMTIGSMVDAGLTLIHPSGNPALDLTIPDRSVLEIDLSAAPCDALIGRDVLARCTLLLDGPAGMFTLTY